MNRNGWRGEADPAVLRLLGGVQAIGAMTGSQLEALKYQERMMEKCSVFMSRVGGIS